jgi:hypothetical protein
LGAIRLCFQAFIEDPITGKFTVALEPVVSDAVHDKKLLPKLIITDISTTCSPISGGKVMLFCNYIDEDDIEVRFFETDTNGVITWETIADLKPPIGEVHKRVGISLISPPYHDLNAKNAINVYLQLRRPSDQRSSEPLIFTYLPDCKHNDCPLLKYNYFTKSGFLPNPQLNAIKKTRNKCVVTKGNDCKKVKVLDIINGCYSDSDEEKCCLDNRDYREDGYECEANNQLSEIQNDFFMQKMDEKVDVNNNMTSNQSNSSDILIECLKTIDLQYLAAMELSEYTEDDWSALNNAINSNNICNIYTNNDNNNSNDRSADKISFISL